MRGRLHAPFPYFGGKRDVAALIWQRLGRPKQYIEPLCGSAAVLLAAPRPAPLEVIGDYSGFIANFWRATKHQPDDVSHHADYPVSHVDLGARHRWLVAQTERLGEALQDPEWPGDAQAAGWWLWGQCAWIGSGWCDPRANNRDQIPHVGNAGMGVQARGQIPHVGDAGMGVQARGKIPHVGDAGRGVQARGKIPHVGNAGRGVQARGAVDAGPHDMLTSAGRTSLAWLRRLSDRLERVRIIHGDWSRTLNHHYGGDDTAVVLDPPYHYRPDLYGSEDMAAAVATWARDNAHLRVALCGLAGDYEMPGWDAVRWERKRLSYGGCKTRDEECLWFSPACLAAHEGQLGLWGNP